MNPDQNLSQDTLNTLNPLLTYSDPTIAQQLTTPGGILSRVLVFIFPVAGLILFVMLIWAGAEIVFGADDNKAIDKGRERATTAVVGFIILFAAYWMAQLLEIVFGLQIL